MSGSEPPREITYHFVSVLPEILKPTGRHFGVSNGVHDIFVAHVVLEGSRVVSIIGELLAS
jgi:hypothetical protein